MTLAEKNTLIHHYGQLLTFFFLFLFACTIIQLSNGLSWASLDKANVSSGEYWRIITAHMTHSNWKHFSLNMIGSGLCLLVFRNDVSTKDWALSALLISIFSSLCMLFVFFEHGRYIGFSDTLYGWVIMGVLYILPKETLLGIFLLVVLSGRILYERLVPGSPFDPLLGGARVAKESHLYGLVGGVLYSFAFNKELRHFVVTLLFKKTARG